LPWVHLLNRLAARGKAMSDGPEGPHAFPDPEDLASLEPDDLKRHGFSSTKARTIIETARAVAAGDLDVDALHRLGDGAAIERLTSVQEILNPPNINVIRDLRSMQRGLRIYGARCATSDSPWNYGRGAPFPPGDIATDPASRVV
jgi:HhH-GPD superfamily base excision DNA repair protein